MFSNIYKDKRVLVTGHTGFKGSWLTIWLQSLGAIVEGYSVDIPTTPSLFESTGLKEKMGFESNDIRDLENLRKTVNEFKPEIVFHLAAQPIVRECYRDPILAFETNMMGTVNILEAIRDTEFVKVAILITSDKCYENVEWAYGYRENEELGGKDPYSASKACAEFVASSYNNSFLKESGIRIATVRAGNVIGGGDWAKDRIVPDAIKAWENDKNVQIRNPRATRPWQFVLEPLSGYMALGGNLYQNEKLAGEAFNFGPNTAMEYPVDSLLNEMSENWGSGTFDLINNDDDKKKEANLLKLSCDKAAHELKWEAALNFKQTVKITVDWYKEHSLSPNNSMLDFTLSQLNEFVEIAKGKEQTWTQ